MIDLIGKIIDFSKNGNSVAKRKWLLFIGLTTIELIMVMLLALPFLETTAAHPALPDDLDSNLQVIGPAEFGHQIDTPQFNSGSEAAIPTLVGTTSLTVSIESSPWAVKDSNGNPGVPDGDIPRVFVVEAAVTNDGTEPATNVTVVLDYDPSGGWILLNGEVPTRTVDTLGSGETTYAYWFAQYPQTNGATHQYTVSAEADNASLVSTSENAHDPDPTKTVEVINFQGTGNNAVGQINITVNNVGDFFTLTQVITPGTNPVTLALNPVGNDDFDPGVYRLVKVEGRILDAVDTELDTFSDEVYLTSLHTDTAKIEVDYTFLAILVRPSSLCSYVGIWFGGNTYKYDEKFCSSNERTIVTVEPAARLSLSKTAEDLNGEPLVVGDIIRYTLQVTNTGTFTAFDVTVTDDLPDEVTCQSVSGGLTCPPDPPPDDIIVWEVGDLVPDQSATLLIDVKINQDAGGQDIVNSATVTSTNAVDPDPPPEVCPGGEEPDTNGNCDETPPVDSDTTLELSKTAVADDPLEVGGNITYTIQVTNTGSYTAFDVTVTDDLPDEVDCVNATATPGSSPACNDPLIWEVGTLARLGGTASLVVLVEVNSSGGGQSITNTVSVTATNVFDPPTVPPICPDNSEPDVDGNCPDNTIPDAAGGVFLPIVMKNN